MATLLSMTESSKKDHMSLERVPFIYYLFYFQKNIINVRALIDLNSEVNKMTLIYAAKLGLKVQKTDIGA